MNGDVVDEGDVAVDESPVEPDVALGGAGAPAGACATEAEGVVADVHLGGVVFKALGEQGVRLCLEPFFQVCAEFGRLCGCCGYPDAEAVCFGMDGDAPCGGGFDDEGDVFAEVGQGAAVFPVRRDRFCEVLLPVQGDFVLYPAAFALDGVFDDGDGAACRCGDGQAGFVDDEADGAPCGAAQAVGERGAVKCDGAQDAVVACCGFFGGAAPCAGFAGKQAGECVEQVALDGVWFSGWHGVFSGNGGVRCCAFRFRSSFRLVE